MINSLILENVCHPNNTVYAEYLLLFQPFIPVNVKMQTQQFYIHVSFYNIFSHNMTVQLIIEDVKRNSFSAF